MEENRCKDCEHFKRAAYYGSMGWCTRFPKWIEIPSADCHWCGEYKEGE